MKRLLYATTVLTLLTLVACNENRPKTMTMEQTKNNIGTSIFPQGQQGPSEWFTGTTWVSSLVNPDQIEDLYSVGQVTFEAGGRTLWHTHPAGQILLVTEGKGWYQERGQEARPLTRGDVVIIPKDVEHWHGAASDSRFVHIAISNMREGSNVTWMTPVTEAEYQEVNTPKQ